MPSTSRTRRVWVSSSVGAWKSGQALTTGWSQARVPSSTKVATSSDVIDLVVEPMRKSVWGVTGAPLVRSRTPKVLLCMVPCPLTTANGGTDHAEGLHGGLHGGV